MSKFVYDDETGAAKAASGRFQYEDAMPQNAGPAEQKPGMFEQAVRGAGQGLLGFGSGMVAGPLAKIAGTIGGESPESQAIRERYAPNAAAPLSGPQIEKAVGGALTYEPTSELGKKTAYALNSPGRWLGQFADWAGRKSEEKSGSPLIGEMARKSIEIAPYGLGRAPGRVPGAAAAAGEAMFDVNKPAPRMTGPDPAVLERARSAGLKLTPSEAGGGMISRGLESFAGEPALSKSIAKANEPVAEGMIAKDLPGTAGEITPDSLALARQHAYSAYQAARESGNMIADRTLTGALDKAVDKFRQQAESFPDNPMVQQQFKAAEAAVKGLDGPVMSADATVSLINNLRERARNAYSGGTMEVELAPVYKEVANALEGQIERHLVRTKQAPEIIDNFRQARTVLAKSAEAEEASKSGTLNPQYYARKFQGRGNSGMTGGARDLGEAAANFPRSLRNPRFVGNPHGPTMMDAISAAALHSLAPGLGSIAADIATLGARPAIRAGLASAPGQAMIGAPLSPAAVGALYPAALQAEALQRGEPVDVRQAKR